MRWVLMLCTCLCAGIAWGAPDALDLGLTALGTTRAGFHVNLESQLSRVGAYRLPMFERWINNPLRIPTWERYLRTSLLDSHGDLQPIFKTASGMIGPGTARDLLEPTPAAYYRTRAGKPDALAAAIRTLDPKARVPSVANVPARVQQMAAMLLFAAADARQWREQALRALTPADRAALYGFLLAAPEEPAQKGVEPEDERFPGPHFADYYHEMDLLGRVDLHTLLAAGEDLAAVTDAVAAELKKQPVSETFAFACHTRYGDIRLAGGTDDRYPADRHYLLILNTSGHHFYAAGGASGGAELPIGILINAGGNATYQNTDGKPAFGAGVLGYGLLADVGGQSHFRSSGNYTQGAGLVGVGLLYSGGHSTFQALGGAQGFGLFGVGVLSAAGDDTFDAYNYCQGCGLPLGCGLLCDFGGKNVYTANDTDIIFPSAQTKEHNTSMAQGVGMGFRRDIVDGNSVGGGVGMLLDVGGDGRFFGGLFCQAAGYWGGVGILDSRGGGNSFRCVWYGQSATAHFGVSYLVSNGGQNTFTATNCVSNAAAHDFSVSLFLDESGGNTYKLTGSGLGEGLNNGLALFVNLGGHNTYAAPHQNAYGTSVVFATSGARLELPTYSLFLDLKGHSSYPDTGPMGNAKTWTQSEVGLHGAGMSVEDAVVKWE